MFSLSTITNRLAGRHTFFALFFTGVGTILAFRQKLDPNFVALAATMQGWVFMHSRNESLNGQGPTQGGNSQ